MVFVAEITFGGNFFIGGESAELKPFSTVSQAMWHRAKLPHVIREGLFGERLITRVI